MSISDIKFAAEVSARMDALQPKSARAAYMGEKYSSLDGISSLSPDAMNGTMGVSRGPSRRFYDPMFNYTHVMSPKTVKQRNRYYRHYFDTDEYVASILELHAELPYSDFELEVNDPLVLREYEEMMDELKVVTKLPLHTLEYHKVGELILHHPFDGKTGKFKHCIALNPDNINIRHTPYIDDGYVFELIPDMELRKLINSTDPLDLSLKKKLSKDIVSKVLTGANIPLNSEDITYIARKSSPYDPRGQSILHRLLRVLQYEDKLREAQLTIADNFIYPLKLFLLGDPNIGWIPGEEHQKALAAMLEQAKMDPDFSIIYHYGLKVQYVTVADKLMNLSTEWSDIDKKKAIALGVSQSFITGSDNYASANVGLQTQLARYRAVRDVFEKHHLMRLCKIMAEKHQWYKRDKREIVGNFRVKRSSEELKDRLMLPEVIWHKKLVMRDDQAYLAFLNNVFNQGKGPVSVVTMLRSMGLDAREELKRKGAQKRLENMTGERFIAPLAASGSSASSAPQGVAQAFFNRVKSLVKTSSVDKVDDLPRDNLFMGVSEQEVQETSDIYASLSVSVMAPVDNLTDIDQLLNNYKPVDMSTWSKKIKSEYISDTVYSAFLGLKDKIQILANTHRLNRKLTDLEIESLHECYKAIYLAGKIETYNVISASVAESGIYNYADEVLLNEVRDWVEINNYIGDTTSYFNLLRDIGNSVFAFSQMRVYHEYGVSYVKIANVPTKHGDIYDIDYLLKLKSALAPAISPLGDIIVLNPKVEYLKYASGVEEDTFLENFNQYKSYTYKGFNITNAPVEYVRDLNITLAALGNRISHKIQKIDFVNDVTEVQAWQKQANDKIAKEFTQSGNVNADEMAKMSLYRVEKAKQSQLSHSFYDKGTLYLSNKIDILDNSFTEKFIKAVAGFADMSPSSVETVFNPKFCNLTESELAVKLELGHIVPITDDNGNIEMYRSAYACADSYTDIKFAQCSLWSKNGDAIFRAEKTAQDIFEQYLPIWVKTPHVLSKDLVDKYNTVFKK